MGKVDDGKTAMDKGGALVVRHPLALVIGTTGGHVVADTTQFVDIDVGRCWIVGVDACDTAHGGGWLIVRVL